MKIEYTEIILNQSGLLKVEAPDSVESCLIRVKKSTPGVEHPIRIQSGAKFKNNAVESEIPSPILCDSSSGDDFLGVDGNTFKYI